LLPPALLAVAVLLLARPQALAVAEAARVLTNIQFVLDVSGSMTAPFGDGTRADKATQALVDFTSYRKGDASGLTPSAATSCIGFRSPRRSLGAQAVERRSCARKRCRPHGGTMIGHALRSVQKILQERPEGDRMVVLISDGESADLSGGVAQELGETLSRDNIVVFYIHVAEGSPQEETFTLASLSGGQSRRGRSDRAEGSVPAH
jgi:Ca-activated chloride channel family protein